MAKASDGTRVSATLTKPIAYDIFLDGQDRARASTGRIFQDWMLDFTISAATPALLIKRCSRSYRNDPNA
jgi:hypothetical protein